MSACAFNEKKTGYVHWHRLLFYHNHQQISLEGCFKVPVCLCTGHWLLSTAMAGKCAQQEWSSVRIYFQFTYHQACDNFHPTGHGKCRQKQRGVFQLRPSLLLEQAEIVIRCLCQWKYHHHAQYLDYWMVSATLNKLVCAQIQNSPNGPRLQSFNLYSMSWGAIKGLVLKMRHRPHSGGTIICWGTLNNIWFQKTLRSIHLDDRIPV